MTNRYEPNGIKKILDVPLRERVYDQIKNLILINKLYPGQTIVIDHLAAELGISHTPVREALVMLELEGLVSTSQYRNPRVNNITPNDVEEIYDMRLLLEPWAIRRAINNIPLAEINEIETLSKYAYEEAGKKNFSPHLNVDIRLHQVILSSTGNQFFWQFGGKLHDRSIRIRSLVEAVGDERDVQTIIKEHLKIIKALADRDADQAESTLFEHLMDGKIRTLAALSHLPTTADL